MVDEEAVLMNELKMWDEKFDSYALEPSSNLITSTYGHSSKQTKARGTSVGNRLYRKASEVNPLSPESVQNEGNGELELIK